MADNPLNVLRSMLKGEVEVEADVFREALEVADDRVEGVLLRYFERAEVVLKELLRRDPKDILASLTLISLLEAKGRYREAEEEFRRAISSCIDKEDRAYLHYCYSIFLQDQGRFRESEEEICRAIELDGDEAIYLLKYASLLEMLGERRRSRKACLMALRLCPHGDPLRKELKTIVKSGGSVTQLLTPPPSSGALLRFIRLHGEVLARKLPKILSNTNFIKFLKSLDEERLESKYLRRARESGEFVKVLLEIERDKRLVKEEEPDEWMVIECLGVLELWKPGFELYLNQLFFQDLCRKCTRPQKRMYGCEHGFANCPLDPEHDEYVYETVQCIVNKLKAGVDPSQILELKVPKKLQNLEKKFRKYF